MQDSIAAPSEYSSDSWNLISSMSNPSGASSYQSSDTSPYPSFSETLSSFQSQNEQQSQTEPGSEMASSQQPFQSASVLGSEAVNLPPNSSPSIQIKTTGGSSDLETESINNKAVKPNGAVGTSLKEGNSVIEPTVVAASSRSGNQGSRSHSVSAKSKPRVVRTDAGVPPNDAHGDSYVALNDQAAMVSQNLPGACLDSSVLKLPEAKELPSPISLNSDGTSKSKNSSGDLAFAIKIKPKATNNSSAVAPDHSSFQPDSSEASVSPSYSAGLKSLLTSTGQKNGAAHSTDDSGGPASLPIISAGAQSAPKTLGGGAAVPQADASALADPVLNTATNNQLLKTVQIRVTGEGNQQVDLRLMERSGALTVSVRSADGTLTRALQQSLPDLSSKLNEQQVKAEWWTPQEAKVASATKSDDSSGDTSGGKSAPQDQSGRNNDSHRQQGGRGTPQPDWVEELSALRNSNQNGNNFTWHL